MSDEPVCTPTPVRSFRLPTWLPILFALAAWGFSRCAPLSTPPTPSPASDASLILLDWEDDISPEILQGFTAETGIPVELRYYYTTEEVYQRLLEGEPCDLAIISNEQVPALIQAERLLPLDLTRVPNFRYIAPAFRDLVIDPGNRYSVPYSWGTTGLVYRPERVPQPPQRWADLWEPAYGGRIFLWDDPRTVIGLTLKALGYSANTADLQALQIAALKLRQLAALPPVPYRPEALGEALRQDQAWVAVAWVGDYILARQALPDLVYALPAEGTLLWMDHYVVPRGARHPEAALRLLNYLLRPEISAQITTRSLWATANEASWSQVHLEPELQALIFPPAEALSNAELTLPLSPEAEMTYNQIWEQFLRDRSTPAPTPSASPVPR